MRMVTVSAAQREEQGLEDFLATVEARAFRYAEYRLGNAEDALDAVQDAMVRLASRYRDRDPADWRPLFYRILNNRIRDFHRRQAVRAKVMAWTGRRGDDPAFDPVEQAPGPDNQNPLSVLHRDDAIQALAEAVRRLPRRQQEVIGCRVFEGMDVAETAHAMGCGEGSVKTHLSRALRSLRNTLGEHW
jgi:RNA polymerase sigma-70 factor, ECF subfamily